jgi:hypothetical protein
MVKRRECLGRTPDVIRRVPTHPLGQERGGIM